MVVPTTQSAAVASAVVPMTQPVALGVPALLVFTASANHDTAVTHYLLEVFPDVAAGPIPTASSDLGKPAPDQHGEISVDRSSFFSALPAGAYVATVTAIGNAGEAASDPAPFIRY